MFKTNPSHRQTNLFSIETQLDAERLDHLQESFEYHFYHLVFSRIREEDFSVIYKDDNGRPNIPINQAVSMLLLMQRHGWTYEQLLDNAEFNLKTRVALGMFRLEEKAPCEASLFNFQNRLRQHYGTTGENLMERVFDGFTQEQLSTLKIKTEIQRCDSTQIGSNIRQYSRVQLLLEVLQRFYRVLREEDQRQYQERFAGYVERSSGQVLYRMSSAEYSGILERLGQLYGWVITMFRKHYGTTEIWSVVERVYGEHFIAVNERIEVRASETLGSNTLQSPDDVEATYRKKNDEQYRGYVIHVSETALPENTVNLITDVVVKPNNVDDSTILHERIEVMKEKTPEFNELHTDGGYPSEENDKALGEAKITHVPSAIRGRKAKVEMAIEQEEPTGTYVVTCPHQTVGATFGRKKYKAVFAKTGCAGCPLVEQCPTHEREEGRVFYFTEAMYHVSRRRRRREELPPERQHLRANGEATMKAFKRLTRDEKVRTRGLFKTLLFAFTTALMINVGRIVRAIGEGGVFFSFFCALISIELRKSFNTTWGLLSQRFYPVKLSGGCQTGIVIPSVFNWGF